MKTYKLGEIAIFKSGGTPSKITSKFWGNDFPWISAKDLKTSVLKSSIEQLTTLGFSIAKKAPKGAVLILVRGMTLYKDVPVCLAGKEVAFNQDIKALVFSEQVIPAYMQYYLSFQKGELRGLVDTAGHGTGRIDTDSLKDFLVQIPSKELQIAIANHLSIWDLAIEKLELLIAAKEKRFNHFQNILINEACKNWKHVSVTEIFEVVSTRNGGFGELLSVTQDRGVIPRTHLEGRVMSPEAGTDSYKFVQRGDFVISLRSFQGGIEFSEYEGLISPAYTVLRAVKDISIDFFRIFFKSPFFIDKYLFLAVVGIRDGKQISISDFMKSKIPLPSKSEQTRVVRHLRILKAEINTSRQLLAQFKKQKCGLMQKLLTGQWQVRSRDMVAK